MMRRFVPVFVVLAIVAVAYAGNSTLSYTGAQSTFIQNRVIPRYNAEHCLQYGLPSNCTTAELVTAGCTNRVIKTITIDSCTIFTSNAAGEQAFLQEVANIGLNVVHNRLLAAENASYLAAVCTRWKAMSPAQQASECTALGLPSTCEACP